MAGAVTEKVLARGFLPATKTTLYTPPATYRADARTICLVNTDTVARSCNIYLGDGTNSYRESPMGLTLNPGDLIELDRLLIINDGDRLEGDASVAGVISYVINGNE